MFKKLRQTHLIQWSTLQTDTEEILFKFKFWKSFIKGHNSFIHVTISADIYSVVPEFQKHPNPQ